MQPAMLPDPKIKNDIYDIASAQTFLVEYMASLDEAISHVDASELESASQILERAAHAGAHIYMIGNGGSSSIANHICCDLAKGTQVPGEPGLLAHSLTANQSLMTAIANDFGFENIFATQVAMYGRAGDVLIAISSSGDSANIVSAARRAGEIGMTTIGLTGFSGGMLRKMADVSVHVDCANYGVVEDGHQIVMHVLAQYIDSLRLKRTTAHGPESPR